jgi:hypothetical protein
MPDRDQVGDPAGLLFGQQRDRIALIGWSQPGMAGQRDLLSEQSARAYPLVSRPAGARVDDQRPSTRSSRWASR